MGVLVGWVFFMKQGFSTYQHWLSWNSIRLVSNSEICLSVPLRAGLTSHAPPSEFILKANECDYGLLHVLPLPDWEVRKLCQPQTTADSMAILWATPAADQVVWPLVPQEAESLKRNGPQTLMVRAARWQDVQGYQRGQAMSLWQ